MSWSNGLTLLRLLAAPLLWLSLMRDAWLPAAGLFWVAVASDWLDGRVARARGEVSALGGLLDHASDAIFVVTGLAALAFRGLVPVPLPWLVGAAFLQYVGDSRALAGHKLRASSLGRWNGILYFVPLGIVATREGLGLAWPGNALVVGIGWALVASTLVSMADRAWAYWSLRRADSSAA